MHFSRLSRRAFTLLELIVVMVIMALLAGLAIPTFLQVVDRSKDSTAETTVSAVLRNSVALSAFDQGEKVTLGMLQKAALETPLAASTEGVFAEGDSFTVVEDPLPSTKYGEMSVKIEGEVVGVAMLSVTGNCILGRVEGRGTPTTWVVKDSSVSCAGATAIAGPGAEPELPGEVEVFDIPKNLVAVASDSQVSLSWDTVFSATGYRVYRDGVAITPTVSNRFTDLSAINGVTYRYTVEAYKSDAETLQSAPAWATPNPPPVAAVTDLNVEAYPTMAAPGSPVGEALVTWTPVSGATAYQVLLDGLPYKIVSFDAANPVSTSEIKLIKLNVSQSYTVSVKSVNTRGTGPQVSADFSVEPSEAVPDVMPAVPLNVSAISGDASALVSWGAVSGARTYRVYVDGVFAQQVKGSSTALKDLENGREHSVSVSAVNFAGESARSISAEFVPYEHLPEVTNPNDPASGLLKLPLSAELEGSAVILSWSSFNGATAYKVTRDGVELTSGATVGFIDSAAVPGETHSYQVTASNGPTVIAVGAVNVEIVPTAPSDLDAVGVDKGAQLRWSEANGAKSYRVYIDSKLVTQTAQISGVIPGLVNGTSYQVSVSSVSAAGESTQSAPVSVVPVAGVTSPAAPLVAPNAPAGFTAALVGSAVSLSWSATDGATGYRVYRDKELLTQVTGVAHSDISIVADGSYSYQVSAFNAAGESSRSASVTISVGKISSDGSMGLPPFAPQSIQVIPGDKSAAVSWDQVADASAYRIYLDGSLYGQAAAVPTSSTLKGLTNGQSYKLTVASVNRDGVSAQSSPLFFTPTATDGAGAVISIPASPRSLVVSGGVKQFQASWAPSTGATGYRVSYKNLDVEGSPVLLVTQTTATSVTVPAPDGARWSIIVSAFNASGTSAASAVTAVTAPATPAGLGVLTASSTTMKMGWVASPNATDYELKVDGLSVQVGASSAVVNNLTANTSYQVRVNASNTAGRSADSAVVTVTTLTAVPTTLRGVDGDKLVNLSWDATPGASAYRLYRDGVLVSSTSSLVFTDTGLVNGLVHSYTLSSVSSRGESAKSAAVRVGAVDPAMKLIPVAPVGLDATVTGNEAAIVWGPVSNALSYVVYVDGTSAILSDEASAKVTGTPGSSVKVKVAARNNAGTSSHSSEIAVTFAPSTPVGMAALYDSNSIALSWAAPTGATMYKVYRSDLTEPVYQGTVRSFTDTNIVNTQTYYYTIMAGNAGGWSALSASVKAAPVPAKPTLTAVGTTTSVNLSWTGSSTATSYRVYRDGVLIVNRSSNTYTDSNAVNFHAGSYTVVAVNTAGESEPSVPAVAGRGPAAPVITSTSNGDMSAVIQWSAVSGVSGYRVYVDGVLAQTLTDTKATVSGLTNGVVVNMSVSWYHVDGMESAQSLSRSIQPAGIPTTPTSLAADPADGYVVLSWSPKVSTAAAPLTGFRVYRDGVLVTTVGIVSSASVFTSDTSAHDYQVSAYGGVGESAKSSTVSVAANPSLIVNGGFEDGLTGWASSGTTSADTTWAYKSGLKSATIGTTSSATTNNTSFLSQTFTVPEGGAVLNFDSANSVFYVSEDSNRVEITDNFSNTTSTFTLTNNTLSTSSQIPLSAQAGHSVTIRFVSYRYFTTGSVHIRVDNVRLTAPTTAPGAPTAPVLQNPAPLDGGAKVTWARSTTGGPLTGYRVYADGALKATVAATGAATQSVDISGLTNGVTYPITVKAYGLGGESTASNSIAVIPRAAPSAVSNVSSSQGSGHIKLAWAAMQTSNAQPLTGFRVYREGALITSLPANATGFNDFAVTLGQAYSYQVSAYGAGGESVLNAPVTNSAGSSVIVNGGFEDGLTGWTSVGTTSADASWVSGSGAKSGLVGTTAYRTAMRTSTLSQTFVVPASGAELKFKYYSGLYSSYYDKNTLIVKDNFSGSSSSIPLPAGVSPLYYQVPLYSQAGHSVTVTFSSYREYDNANTHLIVDDVRLDPAESALTAPAAPNFNTLTALDGAVRVALTHPTTGGPLTGYNVYVNGALNSTVAAVSGQQSFEIAAPNGVPVSVVIKAYGVAGESVASATRSVTPVAPPHAVSNFVGVNSAGAVSLSWQLTASTPERPVSGMRVYRNGALFQMILGTTTPTFSDFSGVVGQAYNYQVAFFGPSGEGPLSAVHTGASSKAVIVNGGFESNLSSWSTTGNVTSTATAWPNKSGSYSALVGREIPSSNFSNQLSQTFTVPAGGATLVFDYQAYKGTALDTTRLVVTGPGGTVANIDLPAGSPEAGYRVPLDSWAGQQVTVRFEVLLAKNPGTAYIYLDSLRVELP